MDGPKFIGIIIYSGKKIVHLACCGMPSFFPDREREFFETLKEAHEAGYEDCPECIGKSKSNKEAK